MGKIYHKYYRILIILLLALLSCTKSENLPPADLKKAYFPLNINSRIIYQMDSTAYSDFTNTSTLYSFELKDSVVAQISESDRTAFIIYRYKRSPGQAWAYQKNFTRTVVDQRAEEYSDNIRYVRFVFPPTAGKTWNGNTYNNLGEQTYSFTDVDFSQTINALKFDSTATVKQIDETNLVREDYAVEVYAKHVGLVKKEVRALDKDISTGKIRRGYQYKMVVKAFN